MFTQEIECQYCSQTRALVQELPPLSDKISLEVLDFVADAARAKELGIDKIPALAIIGKKDYGVRIYGIPYGYELQTLIEAVITVSKGTTDLSENTKSILKEVKNPVHIQVFVSLTCPHCPAAAAVAHKLAVESELDKGRRHRQRRIPRLSHEIQRHRRPQNHHQRENRVHRSIQRRPVRRTRPLRRLLKDREAS